MGVIAEHAQNGPKSDKVNNESMSGLRAGSRDRARGRSLGGFNPTPPPRREHEHEGRISSAAVDNMQIRWCFVLRNANAFVRCSESTCTSASSLWSGWRAACVGVERF